MKQLIKLIIFFVLALIICSNLEAKDCKYGQCTAITKKGVQCKSCAQKGTNKCYFHNKNK